MSFRIVPVFVLIICAVAVSGGALWAAEDAVAAPRRPNPVAQELEKQHAMESARFQQLQQELQDLSGRTDVSSDGLQKTAARLDDQLEALQLEEVGSKVRMEALAEAIAELRKKAEIQAANDEVIGELKKVIVARERTVARMSEMVKQAVVANEEVERANADLAEAKIRLLDRMHGVTATTGGDALSAWNRELINLSVSTHERRAREIALQERLGRIRRALARLPELRFQEEKVKAVRARLMNATYQYFNDPDVNINRR